MQVFFVSNYPGYPSYYQTLQQVTLATFARLGYEVSVSSLNSAYEQELYSGKPKSCINETTRLQSDRYKILSADKIIFQLLIEGHSISRQLENWFQKVFAREFVHSYANSLSEKNSLIILAQANTDQTQTADALGQKVLIEYLVNKYLKVADIKVMPTHIALTKAPLSRQAEKNHILQYSKKIQFYALLLSSSIYTAS
jgi:putative NADPH-quinone reductase